MEQQIVSILNEMADHLSILQMKKLQEVLIKNLCNDASQNDRVTNEEYLELFLDAKKIED